MHELDIKTYQITGSRECGCPSCGRVFSVLSAFDRHRVGRHGEGRKCAENPASEGLTLSPKGVWTLPAKEGPKWWEKHKGVTA